MKRMLQPDEDIGSSIGSMLLSESLLRNIVPVVAPVTSSLANWRMTRRLGDTVTRYMRYHRAFRDEMLEVGSRCAAHFGLLAEGLWFLFSADGRLSPEETGVLAYLVRLLPSDERAVVMARFVEDEYGWMVSLRHGCVAGSTRGGSGGGRARGAGRGGRRWHSATVREVDA